MALTKIVSGGQGEWIEVPSMQRSRGSGPALREFEDAPWGEKFAAAPSLGAGDPPSLPTHRRCEAQFALVFGDRFEVNR